MAIDEAGYPYLEKAYKMQPDNPITYEEMGTWAEVRRDTVKRNFFMKKLYDVRDIETGPLNYCYNIMSGLDKNAIILTFGDMDTYPIWQLQATKGYRRDIMVVNASLMCMAEYRSKIYAELGIHDESAKQDFISLQEIQDFQKHIVQKLAANKGKHPVYVSLTSDSIFTEGIT